MASRLLYFDALFDLELGGYPTDSVEKSAKEMSPLFSFVGNQEDRILMDIAVQDDYWEYIELCTIPHAKPFVKDENIEGLLGKAWGWNEKSVEHLCSLGAVCQYPDLVTVKKINSREWCAAFNHATGTGVPGSRFCATEEEFRHAADDLKNELPLVVKPAFGVAGFGFALITSQKEIADQLPEIARRQVLHGCTIEPWCDRIHDVSSSCEITRDGRVLKTCHYRCHANQRGAFFGIALGRNDPIVENVRLILDETVVKACRALSDAGYFGPVSFDSFVYRDRKTGQERLAPVIEVNGRHVMSTIAHALYDGIGKERWCLFRFINRRNCVLPDTYASLGALLGADSFDCHTRNGILLLSPLRVSHGQGWVQPSRSAFFIVAENSEALWSMDARLKKIVAKRKTC